MDMFFDYEQQRRNNNIGQSFLAQASPNPPSQQTSATYTTVLNSSQEMLSQAQSPPCQRQSSNYTTMLSRSPIPPSQRQSSSYTAMPMLNSSQMLPQEQSSSQQLLNSSQTLPYSSFSCSSNSY